MFFAAAPFAAPSGLSFNNKSTMPNAVLSAQGSYNSISGKSFAAFACGLLVLLPQGSTDAVGGFHPGGGGTSVDRLSP